jgi:hypothetical protein
MVHEIFPSLRRDQGRWFSGLLMKIKRIKNKYLCHSPLSPLKRGDSKTPSKLKISVFSMNQTFPLWRRRRLEFIERGPRGGLSLFTLHEIEADFYGNY